jgi:anti-anti-sigma factor
MTYETKIEDNIKTITISGSIDKLDNYELKREFLPLNRFSKIIVDLTEVVFLDSGFVNLMLELRKMDSGMASRIRLVNPNGNIAEIFRLLSLESFFEIVTFEEKGGMK